MQALLCALLAVRLLPRGFDNPNARPDGAAARRRGEAMVARAHELRRLRLYGLIERIARSRRYRVTAAGIRTALCTGWPTPQAALATSRNGDRRLSERPPSLWYRRRRLARIAHQGDRHGVEFVVICIW